MRLCLSVLCLSLVSTSAFRGLHPAARSTAARSITCPRRLPLRRSHEQVGPGVDEANKALVGAAKRALDVLLADRPFARFFVLETVARVPYFSYLSVLHLQETLGWWRHPDLLQLHFAEAWNELQHLRIMEHLGGDKLWGDRFLAQHVAFVYYWLVVFLYLAAPKVAYNLNKHVEEHAFATYDAFVRENEAWLRSQPVPETARDYYERGDLFMFDRFQTRHRKPGEPLRRPRLSSLFDVLCAVRDDEAEHAHTMMTLEGDPRVLPMPPPPPPPPAGDMARAEAAIEAAIRNEQVAATVQESNGAAADRDPATGASAASRERG